MKDDDLFVIKKAKELSKHTMILTCNIRKYPKKYRFSLVDRMQNKALQIYETLHEANRTDIRIYKRDRLEMQTKVITYCEELSYYIELSKDLHLINMKSMQYWSKMVLDIKRMTIAWRTSDKKRE